MKEAKRVCKRCGGNKEPEVGRRWYCLSCEAHLALMPEKMRCKRCKKVRPRSAFSEDSSRRGGVFPWCKTCQTSYMTGNKFQNEEEQPTGRFCPLDDVPIKGSKNRRFCSNSCKDRAAGLRKKFGLTVENYRALVDTTGGRCPICQNRVTQWHVDHNHKTRKVTGVVCSRCNVGSLASTYHDISFVQRLLDYLSTTPADRLNIEAYAPEGALHSSNLHKRWGFKANADRRFNATD